MECPYCKEDIHDEAIKCKHCGSMLSQGSSAVEASPSVFGYFVKGLKNYATFSGRARRKEYWFYLLFYTMFMLLLSFIDGVMGLYSVEAGIGFFSGIYALALLIPSLAVSVRRLHDTNRSGWWLLISLVPLIGAIVLLVFFCQDSKAENQHGKNPKALPV